MPRKIADVETGQTENQSRDESTEESWGREDRERRPDVSSEQEYVWWLCLQLEEDGWETESEVCPDIDEGKPDRYSRRVDIVASHPEHGRVGIEAKHCSMSRETPNANYRHAFKQITEKYWDLEFGGSVIPAWIIAVSFSEWPHRSRKANTTIDKLGPLFNEFGVGYTSEKVGNVVRFQETSPLMKLCLGEAPYPNADTNLGEPIVEHVAAKRKETKLSETNGGFQ